MRWHPGSWPAHRRRALHWRARPRSSRWWPTLHVRRGATGRGGQWVDTWPSDRSCPTDNGSWGWWCGPCSLKHRLRCLVVHHLHAHLCLKKRVAQLWLLLKHRAGLVGLGGNELLELLHDCVQLLRIKALDRVIHCTLHLSRRSTRAVLGWGYILQRLHRRRTHSHPSTHWPSARRHSSGSALRRHLLLGSTGPGRTLAHPLWRCTISTLLRLPNAEITAVVLDSIEVAYRTLCRCLCCVLCVHAPSERGYVQVYAALRESGAE